MAFRPLQQAEKFHNWRLTLSSWIRDCCYDALVISQRPNIQATGDTRFHTKYNNGPGSYFFKIQPLKASSW